MMYWFYAKHHWQPSVFTKMSEAEKIAMRAFYLQEQEDLEEAREKMKNE